MKRRGLTATAIVLLAVGAVFAQQAPEERTVIRNPEVGPPVTPFVFDGDLRDLPEPAQWMPGDPVKEIPRRFYPKPGDAHRYRSEGEPTTDLLFEAQLLAPDNTSRAFTEPTRNFPGQGFTGVNPPDTVGDVGPNYYIQSINAGGGAIVRIYDKAEPVPNVVTTFTLDNLGSGNCASGLGDPIILYDRMAGRWLLSEFSSGGNRLCVYISRTEDPVSGGWFNYAYQAPSFPDYPHYAVWPTDRNGGMGSYVVTANDGGPGVYALDRGAMLTGTPGTYQRLSTGGLPGFGFEAPTAADLDGPTPPPETAPAIIMRHRDTESHGGPAAPEDLLEMWFFDVDWVSPGNTTLQQQTSIDVAEFDSSLCGLTSFFCFPQPNTGTTLDPLREVIMNRLQYYNFEDYEALAGNYVVDTNGANHGGIRWFELRRTGGGPWELYQEGTYAIDSDNRWMAASALDQSGNFAMAYSVSSSSTFPSLRYTGRLASDPLGVMTQAESNIHAGTASNSSNRWGDYAAMNLDPSDDCTFWFTSLDNTSSNWRTQIASFRFDACGCELEPSTPVATAEPVGDNRIDIGWDDSSLASVVEYTVRRSFDPGGPYETIAVVADTSPGVANGPGYTYEDTDVSGGTTYYYTIVSTDGLACTSEDSNEASATGEGPCTLSPTFDGLQSVISAFTQTCALELSWNPASARCDGPITYNIYRSDTEDFEPGASNLLVDGFPGTEYTDQNVLESGETYYYIVRAFDLTAGVEEQNTVEVPGIPLGELTTGTWTDDAGDTGVAQMALEAPWSVNSSEGNFGPSVYKTGAYLPNLCSGLTTPPLQLATDSAITFWSRYSLENSWDKGEVQVSTDGGGSWERVEVDYPGTSTHTSDACGLPTGPYFTGTNNSWAMYTGDLSPWNGQEVMVRFVLSSDTSQSGTGWWIDDISITNVGVPGACLPGSSCEENPFANVVPDGPITLCEGVPQELTAQLSGGVAPFDYRWLRDGSEIPGEDGATLTVNETGTHEYNVRVSADLCEDEVTDGNDTQITWTAAPLFDGVDSAQNAERSICTIDLDWDAAGTVCGGPVSYTVYRDTNSPVALVEGNRIVSGLTDTQYEDTTELLTGIEYNYVVRAVEGSTGEEDANTVEVSAAPTGPGGGLSTCVAGQANPPPAPDGTAGTSPLRGSRATLAGDAIDLTWDTGSCTASNYNLLYGDLADVASYDLTGSRCGLGNDGSYNWTFVPAGDLFFLVVGINGQGVESSWGTDSDGGERNGDAASGRCLISIKRTTVPCP